MQRFALSVAVKVSSSTFTRRFTTSRPLHASERPLKIVQYVLQLDRETGIPVWRLLDTLRSKKRYLALSAALHNNGILLDEFNTWKWIVSQRDITTALHTLAEHHFMIGDIQHKNPNTSRLIPDWVVLYLVAFKVRSSNQASESMINLMQAYINIIPTPLKGPLIIFAVHHLARYGLSMPMRQVVDTFLTTHFTNESLQFNLILQAISCYPLKSVEIINQIVLILRAMESRHIKLRSETYHTLLNHRLLTLQLTKYLRARMTEEGVTPNAAHLEAYLRIFAKNGAIHDAKEYFDIIHAHTDAIGPVSQKLYDRASTSYLSSHEDRASAFTFLKRLSGYQPYMLAPPAHLAPTSPVTRIIPKTSISVSDYTATLSVAARDLTFSSSRLCGVFRNLPVKPTAVTYTVLIHGLVRRKDWKRAETYWQQLVDSGIPIDKEALAIGLQVLTRAGKPHVAFATLEMFAGRQEKEMSGRFGMRRWISLNHVVINVFMAALIEIRRPDIVFKLWDHMGTLYGVYPNEKSLSILLLAARVAHRLDNSVAGAIAHFKEKFPFRKRPPPSDNGSRSEIVSSIISIVGQPEGLKEYSPKRWDGRRPVETACKIFHQALFGNSPDGRLLAVYSPARAIRFAVGAEPILDIGIPDLRLIKHKFIPPSDLLTSTGKSHFPHIIVNDDNFYNFIVLLGMDSRAAEIPLALAWMRELDIQPSMSTLSVALVFFAEVSVQAPLIEKLAGGPERSEYERLVRWIRRWLGKWPSPGDIIKWRQVVKNMREA